MKQYIVLFIMVSVVFFHAYAEEKIMIDFSKLSNEKNCIETGDGKKEHKDTLVELSENTETGTTVENKPVSITSLKSENWEIVFDPESRKIADVNSLRVSSTELKDYSGSDTEEFAFGINISFPKESRDEWAVVLPPFEIPAYMMKTSFDADTHELRHEEDDYSETQFDSYGIVKNVSILKTIRMKAYGCSTPNRIGIILKDQDNNYKIIPLGDLNYSGWKTLIWNNPDYISEMRDKTVTAHPDYPKYPGMYKLMGIIIYKDAAQPGGDLTTYIRDITISFDEENPGYDLDIDDEAVWGIIQERIHAEKEDTASQKGISKVLDYLESREKKPEEENQL